MPLSESDFVPLEPFNASLDIGLVRNSWSALHLYGINTAQIRVIGVSRDETMLRVDAAPIKAGCVPQVMKRVVIHDVKVYEARVTAAGLRPNKDKGKTQIPSVGRTTHAVPATG